MKRLIYILIAIVVSQFGYAQEGGDNRIDKAIKLIEQEVSNIDNAICYKALVDYSGYRFDNEDEINEWLAVLYFDKDSRIVKSKLKFSFPEEDGYYSYCFNREGVAICSYYSSFSGMSNSYFVCRYLNVDKSLLYIDFLRRDDDSRGVIVDHTCRSGGYNLLMPQVDGDSYDKILDIENFEDRLKSSFGIERLYMPKGATHIKFITPRKGDTTFITRNSVPLNKEASTIYTPIMRLNVGDKVEVVSLNKGWYKIIYREWKGDYNSPEGLYEAEVGGYIEQRFLAKVEIKVND